MLTGVSPFLGDNKQETFLNISRMSLSYSEEEFDVVSESAVDFIKTLLVKKPEDRATAEECLKHPWLTESSIQDPSFKVKGALEEANALQEGQCRQSEKEKMLKYERENTFIVLYFMYKKMHISAPIQFKPMLFKSQLHIKYICYK